MLDLTGKSILVTGGTGSFGKKFVEMVYQRFPAVKRVIVYSRDELKQFDMAQTYPRLQYPSIRFIIGDVRDKERLRRACAGVDIIIHTAALKQAPTAEDNPMEFIKTNILGADNVINAALDNKVKRVVALSTDKASAPISLYGATKLCADKLFMAANNQAVDRDTCFSVVRCGNLIGSRGSVVPFFMEKRKDGILPITHPGMTRFSISPEAGIELIFYALENAWGGEIFVPKLPSYRLIDVAEAIGPDCEHKLVGTRPGERLYEEMISEIDANNTIETDNYYIILPSSPGWNVAAYIKAFNGRRLEAGFRYNSATNTDWLSVEQLREQIRTHVDPCFDIL
ncbi:UDP-N-acetylglucosamine 4,6-dehydratase (inverting) [Spirosoma utsteinense]|uniref:UDP-N-acetylglucosamine 4,6-dehydratase (Inverting) n=1 Tax=Spirosoma utsteinense TaxID=2585773 RepID=A0ABR6W9N6_9BACT|nr:UDP-N-acetylglucosamine 4,6-dehydratase (inverting) [Spirosoma utsteinense]MBC3787278.1 UDP-N-acetylglucosamine 4,6-dehydratase (inverting) [Spirosoma utsteinense]MBC3792964.1 UDP-N-acetylglucosamine 4,6-dehydratase (inverting) [Spirosoma utsteinense]